MINRRDILKLTLGVLLPKVKSDYVPALHLPAESVITKRYELYCSAEALADIRRWGVDQIDEQTRKELYASCGKGPYIRFRK